MDSFQEKKWFIYLGDHHEGPFSLQDIQGKMAQGALTRSSYVWAEGMPDWKVMSDVPAFESLVSGGTLPGSPPDAQEVLIDADSQNAFSPESVTVDASSALPEPLFIDTTPSDSGDGSGGIEVQIPTAKSNPASSSVAPSQNAWNAAIAATTGAAAATSTPLKLDDAHLGKKGASRSGKSGKAAPIVESDSDVPIIEEESAPPKRRKGVAGALLLLTIVGMGGAGYMGYLEPVLQNPNIQGFVTLGKEKAEPALFWLSEKIPALSEWISPIPALKDISANELADLRAAASSPLEKGGPKVAVALSNSDPQNPSFYVSSNLPDGAQFDVVIEGVVDTLLMPGSLLNPQSFSIQRKVTIQKKMGKTPGIRSQDGKPIPRGEYEVYVVESGEQQPAIQSLLANLQPLSAPKTPSSIPKGFKLLAAKTVFLGGLKDAVYAQRLKEFHDKLREKANSEITEVKQYAQTLENEMQAGLAKYTSLSRGGKAKPSLIAKKSWTESHERWANFSSQMRPIVEKWTPAALQSEFFHGILYQMTQQALTAVEQMHQLHHSFFTTTVDQKAFEIQVGQSEALARTSLATLKAKIEQVEKLPPTPNGMPRREGLEVPNDKQ